MTASPALTIKQAAELASCDASTIKRDLLNGRYPGATRDETDRNRAWRIPVDDLVVAGRYRPVVGLDVSLEVAERDREVARLTAELLRERQAHQDTVSRLAVAEATLAAERRHAALLQQLVERALPPVAAHAVHGGAA